MAEYDPRVLRRPMQYPDAVDQACHLWGGKFAHVEVRHDVAVGKRYVVGTKGAMPGARAFGAGSTWEEAFEDAARRGLT